MKKLIVAVLLAASAIAWADTIIYLPPGGGIQTCIVNGGVITCL